MKRVEQEVRAKLVYNRVQSTIHPEKYFYEWKFNKEARQEFKDILKGKAKDKKINSFIHYLEGLCLLKKMLIEQDQRLDIRETREHILKVCKTTLKHLQGVYGGRTVIWYDETIDPFWNYQPEQEKVCPECKRPFTTDIKRREKCGYCEQTLPPAPHKDEDFIIQAMDAAENVILPMMNFIKIIENYHKAEIKKNGRPKAENDHFIEKIAGIYDEHIEKPTLYEDGPFFAIVKTVRGIFGLPREYPKRAIWQALKNYFTSRPDTFAFLKIRAQNPPNKS